MDEDHREETATPPASAGALGAEPLAGWQAENADCRESRLAFTGRRIQLRVDRVRLPNGRETELEMIRHPGAAAIVPLLASGDVLLVRQYRYATGGWLLEVPAGTLNAGEAPAACAARELVEETGYRAGELMPLGWIWTTPGFTDEKIWLYLATSLTAARQALEDDELLSLIRVPLASAVTMALGGAGGTLALGGAGGAIVDGKSVAALLRAERALRGAPTRA